MIINQKKVAQVILSKLKKDGTEQSATVQSEQAEGDHSALHAICQDILLAVENKSAGDLAEGLKAAFQAIDAEEDESQESQDDDQGQSSGDGLPA